MRTALALAIALALAATVGSLALAGTVETSRSKVITEIDALALTSARWTGWIDTANYRSVAFDIAFTDANSSNEAVTMVCETDADGTAADDGGEELQTLTIGAADALSRQIRWCQTGSNTTCGGTDGTAPGTLSWTWTVSNLPAPWVNCKFDVTGGSAASADVLTVISRRITP